MSFFLLTLGVEEITAGVDEEGNIYLSYNCSEISEASQFTWCKSYEEVSDDQKFKSETIAEKYVYVSNQIIPLMGIFIPKNILFLLLFFFLSSSKLFFKNPDKDDLGTYSVEVSDTDGISSSFVMDADGKNIVFDIMMKSKLNSVP